MAQYKLLFVNSSGARLPGMSEVTVFANDESSIQTMSKARLVKGINVNIISL